MLQVSKVSVFAKFRFKGYGLPAHAGRPIRNFLIYREAHPYVQPP